MKFKKYKKIYKKKDIYIHIYIYIYIYIYYRKNEYIYIYIYITENIYIYILQKKWMFFILNTLYNV